MTADPVREALAGVVSAWETLSGGHHSVRAVQKWLVEQMKPAIDNARLALSAPPAPDQLARLREAAQAVVDAWTADEGDIPTSVKSIVRLRTALASPPPREQEKK